MSDLPIIAQRKILKKADNEQMVLAFKTIKKYLSSSRWLGENNTYKKNVIQKIKKQYKFNQPQNNKINNKHLREYIAVSSFIHCVDGWKYISQAANSLFSNDGSVSIHLAYYAELRAAMSILATSGIGIFNNQHFIVNKKGICDGIPPSAKNGTHDMTWLALNYWANNLSAIHLLSKMITIDGNDLETWLTYFDSAYISAWKLVGSTWLKKWGIDLKTVGKDHTKRNDVSYRPTQIHLPDAYDPSEINSFSSNLWMLFEPSYKNLFSTLDRHLLRTSLETIHESTTGQTVLSTQTLFKSKINTMLDGLSLSEISKKRWHDFLLRISAPDTHPIIKHALKKNVSMDEKDYSLGILSRAILLLRVSTGLSVKILKDSNIKFPDLSFWSEPFSKMKGILPNDVAPTDLFDLWQDVENAINDIRTWEQAQASSTLTYYKWNEECSKQLKILSTFERVPLWSIFNL